MLPVDTDLRGQLIASRYLVEDCIGRGGMGVVWRVRHVQSRQLFALKTIRGTLLQDKKVIRRLLHEARATAAVKSRHVVRIVDVEPDYVHAGAPLPYIVMELLEGQNLSEYLARVGTLSVAELVWVMHQVSQALSLAHTRGIVHRDLKPSNVFLASDDEGAVVVKVCDFGIAKLQGTAIADLAETGTFSTTTGEILGTPRYMAPEQLRRTALEAPTTDQWAFALIVFRALTGRNYFEDATNVAELVLAIVHDALPAPSSLSPLFPRSLDAWFARSCSRNPDSRHPNIDAQNSALEKCLGAPQMQAIEATDLHLSGSANYSKRSPSRRASQSSDTYRQAQAPIPRAQSLRRLLFFIVLGGAACFALVEAHWLATYLAGSKNSSKIQSNFMHPMLDSTAVSSVASPDAMATGVEPPQLMSANTLAVPSNPPTEMGAMPALQRRLPTNRHTGLAPSGAACSRSHQCESGMCAAELCQ
jgi:serine/threonine-protein kinase